MKTFSDFLEGRCWPGHKPVPGKKPFSPGSCMKEDDIEEDWSQKYKSDIDCDNPKGFSQKAHCAGKKKDESVNEDLRNWFSKTSPKGDWKRINSKGEAIGPCAREPGEPKPKCMSQAQRASLSKKERASAVRRKRQQDPDAERQGAPINVKSKVNENMEQLDEKNKPTNPELWARAIAQAKSKFDVYPSAYANGWASKWYKEKGGGWKSVAEAMEVGDDPISQGTPEGLTKRGPKTVLKKFKELSELIMPQVKNDLNTLDKNSFVKKHGLTKSVAKQKLATEAKDEQEYGYEGDMALNQLATLIRCGEMIRDMLKPDTDLPEWVQSKITLSTDYIQTAADYLYSEMKEEVQIDELSSDLLGRYKTAAGADASKADKAGDYDKGNKRFSGIMKATKKQFANDMKEAFKPMDEPNYNNSIQARQKKADDDKPPFDGPYKKTPSVVTDKSGAKHGGMSIARHLAKQAAKKQAGSIREEKQKSRKAQIIKDASRGKDKFEKDPIITDTTVKTDNLQ